MHTLWRQAYIWLGMVFRDDIKISDSENIWYSIIDTVILLTKIQIYVNRQKVKVTNIAEIKYELSVQLWYE